MSESIVFHTHVRIKDGEFGQFLDAAKRFVDVVEEEPGALKCGCYVDREARTVVFVEVFTYIDASLGHWEFPGIKAIQPEMVPRLEEFERMDVYGHVPEEILAGFAEQGFALTAMPDTTSTRRSRSNPSATWPRTLSSGAHRAVESRRRPETSSRWLPRRSFAAHPGA